MTIFTYIRSNNTIYIDAYDRTLPVEFIKNLEPEKLQRLLCIDTKEDVPMTLVEALKRYSDMVN